MLSRISFALFAGAAVLIAAMAAPLARRNGDWNNGHDGDWNDGHNDDWISGPWRVQAYNWTGQPTACSNTGITAHGGERWVGIPSALAGRWYSANGGSTREACGRSIQMNVGSGLVIAGITVVDVNSYDVYDPNDQVFTASYGLFNALQDENNNNQDGDHFIVSWKWE